MFLNEKQMESKQRVSLFFILSTREAHSIKNHNELFSSNEIQIGKTGLKPFLKCPKSRSIPHSSLSKMSQPTLVSVLWTLIVSDLNNFLVNKIQCMYVCMVSELWLSHQMIRMKIPTMDWVLTIYPNIVLNTLHSTPQVIYPYLNSQMKKLRQREVG